MSEIKIGDLVHARTPNTAVPWIGIVTAIERSSFGTVYVTDVGHNNTIRATEATVAEVADEPSWRQTAENLREALVRCTEERDGARRDRDYWRLLESQHLEWGRGLERERNEATHALNEAHIQLHRFLTERDAALERVAKLEAAIKAEGEASNSTMCAFWRVEDERDALTKERAEVAKERDLWRGLAGERYECLVQVIALRDAARKECAETNRTLDATHIKLDEVCAFLSRTAMGGSIVSSATMAPAQIAAARATDRMLVTPDGYGFVYLSSNTYEMTCDLARVAAERDAAREERDTLRKTGENLREALNFWCGRAETLAVSRDEATRTLERVTAERDEARNEALAKSGGFWGRAAAIAVKERDEARAERDALDRRCAETIRALDLVTVERDALRRRAAQLAELLRAEGLRTCSMISSEVRSA